MITKIEKEVHSKRVDRNEAKGTVTLFVEFHAPTRNNGIRNRRFDTSDAERWLTDGGVKVGKCLSGGRVRNNSMRAGASGRVVGEWTFEIYKEPEEVKAPPAPAKPPTKAKVVSIKETVGKDTGEFDGLNFDGDTAEEPKTKPKRKTRKRK